MSINDLTPRLVVVGDLLCEGLTNKEIAYRLGVSVNTIRNHVTELYSRLGVSSRGEAMSLLVRNPDARAAKSLEHALEALEIATKIVTVALVTVRPEETE